MGKMWELDLDKGVCNTHKVVSKNTRYHKVWRVRQMNYVTLKTSIK